MEIDRAAAIDVQVHDDYRSWYERAAQERMRMAIGGREVRRSLPRAHVRILHRSRLEVL